MAAKKGIRDYLFPYQKAWLADTSRYKIWEKSRRIGATYVQALEDVLDCMTTTELPVWFSSADETAAKEYILYCEHWAKIANAGASAVSEEVIDEKNGVKTYNLEFLNGSRIHAMSSNPKGFRSKGGKVILDEFAWHKDQQQLWAAAQPCVTWGYPLRVLSTHNGKQSLFYSFLKDIRDGKLSWNIHLTPIQVAVEQGLADRIEGRKLTRAERQQWLEKRKAECRSEEVWRQEYCCEPVDESSAFLPFEMLLACEKPAFDILRPLEKTQGDLYAGYDVGRHRDLSVIYVAELLGSDLITRQIYALKNMPFSRQMELLESILRLPRLRRCCIDASGLGMNLAENAQARFGSYKAEAVTFTNAVKEELATDLRIRFEDRRILIPSDEALRNDLHSVKCVTTIAGNRRFDVSRTDTDGHADRFWALALCCHAAKGAGTGIPDIRSRHRRESGSLLRRF